MNCRFDTGLLSSYADGALSREQAVHVVRHTSGCEECSRSLRELRAFGDILRLLPHEPAPAGLIGRILGSAAQEVRLTVWTVARRVAGEIWRAAGRGFTIEEVRQELLRNELPPWVLRWILFV
jgi:anti-sigma factor RsiW